MKCNCCNKHFEICNTNYKRGRGIYCSDECNKKRKHKQYNGRWNGGIREAGGYTLIHKNLVEDKYKYLAKINPYIPEHRIVASKKYNKILTKKDIIHHLNGVRNDNREENLIITNNKDHERHTFEKQLQKRILELEEKLKEKI